MEGHRAFSTLLKKKPAMSTRNQSDLDPVWADKLNRFFASVGPDVADALASCDAGETLSPRPPRVCSGRLSLRPATLPELSAALQQMSSSRASGSDGITISMLRATFPVVGPHLLSVINSSIVTCEVPRQWKSAIVTPLHKKGDPSDPSNYRPISILPTVAKLCERVVCRQLTDYLSSHHILCPQQYGFRPGLSTEAAMLDAVIYATDKMAQGKVTSLITADTSKAFDSVEHGRLLEKLGWYGIDAEWFSAWLRDRTQSLRGGTGILDVTHGVVQGSILGPLLFLVFTNDLPQHIPHGKMILYADDAQFLDADLPQNTTNLKMRLEESLAVANNWFIKNRLKINPRKTEMILIKSRRLNTDVHFSVNFDNSFIEPSHSVKILGVTVDSCLSWEPHVSALVRRCYGLLIGLARTRYRLPAQTKRLLIEALVFPHIRYCLSVWGSCTATQKRRVQKALNFAARIIANAGYRDHVTPLLHELGWLRIEGMIFEHDVLLMRDLLTAACAPEFTRDRVIRRSDVSDRLTRASSDGLLELPRVRTEFSRRSFLYRGSSCWNSLPLNVRSLAASSKSAFKSAITSHMSIT